MKINPIRALSVFAVLALILILSTPAQAAAPYGVDHLRGRWDGGIDGFDGREESFVLMLDKYGVDPSNPNAFIYNGCMKVGGGGYAPVSVRAVALANEEFDLTIFGTALGQVIKMTGRAFTNAARVTDDLSSGIWQTAWQEGDWSAFHHDRRKPNCSSVNLGDELWFHGDIYTAVGLASNGERAENSILESFTNIVSSGVRVDLPGGGTMVIPFYTDLFSPGADFVTEFRYLQMFDGLPASGQTYDFTLLDPFGQPIPGANSTDIWLSCPQDAPRNVAASLSANGLEMTWDAVPPAAGFDPGGPAALGFYQIEVGNPNNGGNFGAGGMHTNAHLIPFVGFGGFAPGFPDGMNFGSALSELPDGTYWIETIAFSAAVHAGGFGHECQIRSWDEQVYFDKLGDTITILP
jgi:hypothetical protein